jgi:serine-type D-Ala-D-Ala carboxypeptidase (penicillin-binding protein 5/6)
MRQIFLFVGTVLGLFFYPGENYLYSYEQTQTKHFAQPQSLPDIRMKFPVVKEGVAMPSLSAQGVYVVETKTFTVVYQKNADTKTHPASTVKMLTALTTLKERNLHDIVTVQSPNTEGQTMGLQPSEKMSVKNLLYGILVHSANDAAYALAGVDKDYKKFVENMNLTAHRLGMNDSNFTNPAGLDDDTQLTTPHDLALVARAVLADPTLRQMVSVKNITVLDEDFRYTHELTNINELLGEVQGIGGVKTGYTEEAGENLVSYFKTPYNLHEYIIVVTKSEDRFADTKILTDWIIFNIDYI